MRSSKVLKELLELKQTYVTQNFKFNVTQKERYAELLNKRRSIVKEWYKNGQVWTPSMSNKPVKKEEVK